MTASMPPGAERYVVVGANHQSSSLALRDRLFVEDAEIPGFLAALSEAGATLQDVVKTTVFLTNVKRDFQGMNEVYAKRFGEHRPTRSTIGAELALEALVEIEAVAVLRGPKG